MSVCTGPRCCSSPAESLRPPAGQVAGSRPSPVATQCPPDDAPDVAACGETVAVALGWLSVGAVGGVAGWRLVGEGGVGSVVVVLILPISDDDAGVRQ